MPKLFDKIVNAKYGWVILLLLLAGINIVAFIVLPSIPGTRFDLTKEKRYTLSKATEDLVRNLDGDVQIDVFLKGEFPSGFRKLADRTNEFLQLLKEHNGSRIHYRFISPQEEMPGSKVVYGDSLVGLGAVPINLTVQKKAGESSNIIFPVALMHYHGRESLINLYPGASGRISQEETNSAEALMEYQFAKAMDRLIRTTKPGIAYATGNGEPTDGRSYDLVQTLRQDYEFGILDLQAQPVVPASVNVMMIVKPTLQFTEEEKIKIDQFVMRGGKLLCFIDDLIAEQDSLSFKPETIAYDRNLNLTDLFFHYGVRINPNLVMDLQCDVIPLVVGGTQDNPQFDFLHWNYFPLFAPAKNQLQTRNLGYVASRFANSLDTIEAAGVKKTVLLSSSPNSRVIGTPALISLNENKDAPEDDKFKRSDIPVAMLLQGKFSSLYKNRISKAQMDTLDAHGSAYRSESVDNNSIIVAGDGDIVLNDVMPETGPLPMGWNKYTYREYQKQTDYGKLFVPVANREFLLNCTEYLTNDPGISETRNKDIVLRLLDTKKVNAQKSLWQFINIAIPVLIVILAGFIYQQMRKRRYSS